MVLDRACCYHAVRCIACDGAGRTSEVIAGVDWVASNLVLPAVISMSLGASETDAVLDAAVSAVIGMGAQIITAAGNFNNGMLCIVDVDKSSFPRSADMKPQGLRQCQQTRLVDTIWPLRSKLSVSRYLPHVEAISTRNRGFMVDRHHIQSLC